jgi:hypothetical protein
LVSLWFGIPHLAETIAGLGDKVVGAMVSNLLEIHPFAKWGKEFLKTPQYIWYLRTLGMLFIIAGAFMATFILFANRP